VSDIEIEIKVKVAHADRLEAYLGKHGTPTGEGDQKDDYYTPAHRNFMDKNPVEEWFRIRGTDSGKLTYKRWHFDEAGHSNYCDEYESGVDDVGQMRKILAALNFEFLVTVEKHRRTWMWGDYEVAIDAVANLGDFVEVEYKGTAVGADPAKITRDMVEFLKSAGCTDIQRSHSGYPFALLHPEKQEFVPV